MNILSRVTWKAMWKNRTRTLVTIVGVILSAAMFMAVVTLGLSFHHYLLRGYTWENGDYYVRFQYSFREQKEALLADARVSSVVAAQTHGFYTMSYEEGYGALDLFALLSADQRYFDTMNLHLSKGRLPQNSRELVVSEFTMLRMDGLGIASDLGDTVTLNIFTDTSHIDSIEEYHDYPTVEQREYTVTYTIVGIMTDRGTVTSDASVYSYTLADGGEPEPIWYTLCAKTHDPADSYEVVSGGYGSKTSLNNDVLMLMGITQYSNMNFVIVGICAVLVAIIMIGSVSLIHNSFSISVSERTKQFGLLSSVGATKKQLRRSILFEGSALCVLGIPIGIICGWGGIAVTLSLLADTIGQFFFYDSPIQLRAVISLPGIACAAGIGVATVFLSAWIPARRAAKISPVAAIRQTADYKATAKQVKVSKLTGLLFGLSGIMAKKYYSVSKRKYRSTIRSLAISIFLFLAAAYLGNGIRSNYASAVTVSHYDFVVYGLSEAHQETLRELTQMDGIEAVWLDKDTWRTVLPAEDMDDAYTGFHQGNGTDRWNVVGGNLLVDVSINYVEDEKLKAWLLEHDIDPTPYFDLDNPVALVQKLTDTVYSYDGSDHTRKTLTGYGIVDSVDTLSLYGLSADLLDIENHFWREILTEDGYCWHGISQELWDATEHPQLLWEDMTVGVFYLVKLESSTVGYYLYDPISGETAAEPAVTAPAQPGIQLGARVEGLDLTDSSNDLWGIDLVRPLSAKPDSEANPHLGIRMEGGRATAIREYLEEKDVPFNDHLESQQRTRGYLLIIDVFSYGFIILISLICVANVFNTVSTNIALRRRDFGMLRSVGMKTKEIYRMMNYECLIYGGRALLWGIPLGLLACYGIHSIFGRAFGGAFMLPWGAMAVAALCVFAVVFSSMFYAVSKLRRDNPIEAIRQENL